MDKSIKSLLELAGVDTSKGLARKLSEGNVGHPGHSFPDKNQVLGNKDKIIKWLAQHNVHNYTVNDHGYIDVEGDVRFDALNMPTLPGPIHFGIVKGDFVVSASGLTSLQGCPQQIDGDFLANHNELKDLVGGPKVVTGIYSVAKNPLVSIKGLATHIGADLHLPMSLKARISEIEIRKFSHVDGKIFFYK